MNIAEEKYQYMNLSEKIEHKTFQQGSWSCYEDQ